jgi:hypothetical protein
MISRRRPSKSSGGPGQAAREVPRPFGGRVSTNVRFQGDEIPSAEVFGRFNRRDNHKRVSNIVRCTEVGR